MEYEVIDCHVHPFINQETNTMWFSQTDTPDDFVAELKRAGISKCCGTVIKPLTKPTFDQIKALNREALAFHKRFPDFFIPGIHVHPSYPEESCREIEYLYHHDNVRWVGELVGYIVDFPSYLGDGMFRIYDLIQHLGIPVNIHPAAFEEISVICKSFPKLNVVIAHPTAKKNDIIARFEVLRKYPNAYLDISGSGLFRWGMLRHGINIAGAHKFIFGTDFPIINAIMQVQGILAEHLTDAERQAVFSGNFKRLLGMAE